MSIKITRPGMFSTIQDLGRQGHRSVGIGPGGAMDFFAAAAGNFLAGNDAGAALLEMHFPAAALVFQAGAIIALTGADFDARLDDEPAALWQPLLVQKGTTLSFKKKSNGARVYLAVMGGLVADQWLGSYSTQVKIKAAGFHGRPLQKNDVLEFNRLIITESIRTFQSVDQYTRQVYAHSNIIRCIAGPEYGQLDATSKEIFVNQAFQISPQSDRMGFRLQGVSLAREKPVELISSPVDAGIVQLLPNGQLILLMADHQTTGGYPRIASVIRADLPKLAQLPVHAQVYFQLVELQVATEALISMQQNLTAIKNQCDHWYAADRHQL